MTCLQVNAAQSYACLRISSMGLAPMELYLGLQGLTLSSFPVLVLAAMPMGCELYSAEMGQPQRPPLKVRKGLCLCLTWASWIGLALKEPTASTLDWLRANPSSSSHAPHMQLCGVHYPPPCYGLLWSKDLHPFSLLHSPLRCFLLSPLLGVHTFIDLALGH